MNGHFIVKVKYIDKKLESTTHISWLQAMNRANSVVNMGDFEGHKLKYVTIELVRYETDPST